MVGSGVYVEGRQNQFLDNLLTGWNGVGGWDGVNGTRNAWLRNTIVDTEEGARSVFYDIWGDCTHNRWQRNVASASCSTPPVFLSPPRVANK